MGEKPDVGSSPTSGNDEQSEKFTEAGKPRFACLADSKAGVMGQKF